MTVLEPAAIEATVLATEQEKSQQYEIISALKRKSEAAQNSARRADKQYDTTDPDNRLVASELERRWNEALQRCSNADSHDVNGAFRRDVNKSERSDASISNDA